MKSLVFPATAVLALTVALGVANASGPIAVYALVDKVTFEPNADKPERIRISGVFITAGESYDVYLPPQRGHLYFALPAANADLARREWTDLKSVAGTRQVVGFGSSWGAVSGKLHIQKTNDATSPDQFPMGNGLVKINADHPSAKALLEYKDR
jgi:hypothetical protein